MVKCSFSLLGLLLLGACTNAALTELKRAPLPDDPYRSELSVLYLRLAESEAGQYDWQSSQYFADKGLLASYGHEVTPATPEEFFLPEHTRADVDRARERLHAAMGKGRDAYPKALAQAVASYDCWLEQLEENWQHDDIKACHDAFEAALSQIGGGKLALQHDTTASRDVIPASLSDSYLVFFGWGASELSAGNQKTLDHAVAQIRAMLNEGVEVTINGHTDSTGDERENMNLSLSRAKMVKAYLEQSGIPGKLLSIFAFGESDPRVKTADNTEEPANRRVELFIE